MPSKIISIAVINAITGLFTIRNPYSGVPVKEIGDVRRKRRQQISDYSSATGVSAAELRRRYRDNAEVYGKSPDQIKQRRLDVKNMRRKQSGLPPLESYSQA